MDKQFLEALVSAGTMVAFLRVFWPLYLKDMLNSYLGLKVDGIEINVEGSDQKFKPVVFLTDFRITKRFGTHVIKDFGAIGLPLYLILKKYLDGNRDRGFIVQGIDTTRGGTLVKMFINVQQIGSRKALFFVPLVKA